MENYFDIALTDDQIRNISSIGLAHMGDAVFYENSMEVPQE